MLILHVCSIIIVVFQFMLARLVILFLFIFSVAFSSFLFYYVFPVDEFQLFPEVRGPWEHMTSNSMECCQRSSLLPCEFEVLVATAELQAHRNKIL